MLFLISGFAAKAAPLTIQGVYALAGIQQQVAGTILASPNAARDEIKLDISFRRRAEMNALKRYDLDFNQEMHVIVVSDDFQYFLHRWIPHVIDGHGQIWLHLPQPRLYHIFVEAIPRGIGLQALRFDLALGTDPAAASNGAPPIEAGRVSPYQLVQDPVLPGQTLSLRIQEHGRPAKTLHLILGQAGLISMINSRDLTYVPLAAAKTQDAVDGHDNHSVSAELTVPMIPEPVGAFRLWLHFMGGRMDYVAPITGPSP